jgi:hypothetical protein
MGGFKERDQARDEKKRAELAPYIEAALARKKYMAPIADADIPVVEAFGRKGANVGVAQASTFADRGGAISVPRVDPRAKKESVG